METKKITDLEIFKNLSRMKKHALLLLFGVLAMFQSRAHVGLNNPVGGETFNPGDTVIVEWQIAISHTLQNWDLFFSDNGGSTWDAIQIDIPSTGSSVGTVVTYEWVVPATQTTQARIKIVMDNAVTDYEGISGDFTITSITDISESLATGNINTYPNPLTNYATLEFDNSREESHILTLYDTQGRLVRTITNITTGKVIVLRKNLTSGLYFFQLSTKKEVRAIGKLIIE